MLTIGSVAASGRSRLSTQRAETGPSLQMHQAESTVVKADTRSILTNTPILKQLPRYAFFWHEHHRRNGLPLIRIQ